MITRALGFARILILPLVCAVALAAAPTISGVYNAGSYVPVDLPNSGVAQGSIFIVKGSGLGPSVLQQVQSYPLPTTAGLAGTTAQVTVSGVTETCIMVYTSDAQIAAILPSATPVGTGTLSVSYQGGATSAPIVVVAANFGTFTLNEGGTGPAVITDTNYNPITFINPAQAGQTLILWGTGLGAATGDETMPPNQVDLGTGVQVFIENKPATILYGGRGSSPGLDQIDFVVPTDISGGCKTSVAVLVKGITGGLTSTAIAPPGQPTCADTYGALTADNLQKAIANGALSVGFVEASRIGANNDTFLGGFGNFTLNSLIRSFGGSIGPSIGSCIAYETYGISPLPTDPIQSTLLATGSDLVLTGPGGAKNIPASGTGEYLTTLATQPNEYLQPGAYTVANGSGGSNVGPFNWSLTLPAYVVPTNIPASVSRSQDLTVTWSGSSGYSVVSIFGISGVPVALPQISWVEFICNAAASAGTFTIPSVVLNLLPSNGYGSLTKKGVDIQIAGVTVDSFNVAGSPGLDAGLFSVFVSNGSVATVQ